MPRRKRRARKQRERVTRKLNTFRKTTKKSGFPINLPIIKIQTKIPRAITKKAISRAPPKTVINLQRYNAVISKIECKYKRKRNNDVRRRNFFRAKAKGATSARPEHERRYKKC